MNRLTARLRPSIRSTCLVLLMVAAMAGLHAEPLSLASDPLELARAALGALPGSSAVGVWRDGKVSQAGTRDGAALPSAEVGGDKAALFEIGSITKVFTGLLLAQAVERGDLGLDDTLGKLLEGKVTMASDKVGAVTLRQLVTHTSCLPRLPADFREGARRDDPYRNYGRARLWAALASMKFDAAPPCAASYSNLGVGLLGELLSEHYGKPWDVLVRERITEPLGMHDTVRALGDRSARLAPGFNGSKPAPPWEMQAFAGAGSLRSTPADLLLFGRAILAGRNGPLGPAAERLVTPLARFDGGIGYAIFVRGPPTRRTFVHTGGTGGYRSQLLLAADTGEVMVVLASNAEAPVHRVGAEVLASRYPVEAGGIAIEPSRLAAYAGVFRVDPNAAFTLVVQDGALHLHSTGQPFVVLAPSGPDSFTLGTRGRVVFERDGDGAAVSRVTVSSQGVDHLGLRTPEPVPPSASLPDAQLRAFVGRYRSARLSFDVQAGAGQLTVKLNEQPRFPVFPVADRPDRFAYDVVRAELQFERYPNGEVRGLVLHQNGEQRVPKVE